MSLRLNKEKWLKVGKGAAIAGGGAAAVYLLEALPELELGIYMPIVAAALSVLINYLRQVAKK